MQYGCGGSHERQGARGEGGFSCLSEISSNQSTFASLTVHPHAHNHQLLTNSNHPQSPETSNHSLAPSPNPPFARPTPTFRPFNFPKIILNSWPFQAQQSQKYLNCVELALLRQTYGLFLNQFGFAEELLWKIKNTGFYEVLILKGSLLDLYWPLIFCINQQTRESFLPPERRIGRCLSGNKIIESCCWTDDGQNNDGSLEKKGGVFGDKFESKNDLHIGGGRISHYKSFESCSQTDCQISNDRMANSNRGRESQSTSALKIFASLSKHFSLNCLIKALIAYNKSKYMQNYLFFAPPEDYPTKDEILSNAGSWALEENLSYAIFIDIHKKSMTSKKKMREMQFYEKLSAFIATRTSSQCRSHHQKMFDKFKYISKIVELFKIKVGVPQYRIKFQEGLQKMKDINHRFSSDQNAPPLSTAPSEPLPLPPSSQINNTFVMEPTFVPVPLLFNNFYLYGGDYQAATAEAVQGLYFIA